MSQQMNVLCCFSCSMYQVHIVKKSNKWQCKICGNKQSIQIIHFQGSGSDCRKQVQHLNSLKAKREGQQSFHSVTIDEYGLDCVVNAGDEIGPCDCPGRAKRSAGKWEKYLETEDEDDSESQSSEEKENRSASLDNIRRSGNREERRKQSYSLPPTQNSSKMDCEPDETSYKTKVGTSRSRTYPRVKSSSTNPSKWNKYLNEPMESSTSNNSKTNLNENLDEISTPSNYSSKNLIFDDLNDNLDVDLDF